MNSCKFHEDFKKAREAAKLTQERVAELLNVCREEIVLIELHGRLPKVPTFLLCCRLFGLNPMDYIERSTGTDDPVHPH